MNNTDLGYRGFVKAKLKIGDKIVEINKHNEGTDYLFKLFSKFLTNNQVSTVETPQILDLQYKSKQAGSEWETWLSKVISFTGREYFENDDPEGWAAKFSAVIIHSNLIQTITEDMDSSGDFRLVMCTGTNDSIEQPIELAYLKVAAKDLAKIVPGTQAIVEWIMMVTNVV